MQINICLSTPALARALILGGLWALALAGCGGSGGGDSTVAMAPPIVAVPPVTATSPSTPAVTPATTPATGTENPTSGSGGTTATLPTTSTATPTTTATHSSPIEPPVARGSLSIVAGRTRGGPVNIDGVGTTARFSSRIGGMAGDAAGNLYVADTDNFTLRKVSPAGVVTTLAGRAGPFGALAGESYVARTALAPDAVDGHGSEATFHEPQGIAVDGTGTIYVMDSVRINSATRSPVIRKVSPTGAVTTLKLGPEASSWRFDPESIAVDSANNLYVIASNSQINNTDHAVLKITPSGSFGVLATFLSAVGDGNLTGNEALLRNPRGIAVDGLGNVVVGGDGIHRKISPAGVISLFRPEYLLGATSVDVFGILAVDSSGSMLALGVIRVLPNSIPQDAELLLFRINSSGYVVSSTYFRHRDSVGLIQFAYQKTALTNGKLYGANFAEINQIGADGFVAPWVGKNQYPYGGYPRCGAVGVEVGSGFGICSPQKLTLDGSGNIFFIDRYDPQTPGSRSMPVPADGGQVLPSDDYYAVYGTAYNVGQLRKVSKDGVISGVLAHRYGLSTVAVDAAGNTYVGERFLKEKNDCYALICGPVNGGGTVWKLSRNGAVSKIWTSTNITPKRIAIDDSGNLYVGTGSDFYSDRGNYDYTMVKLSPDGRVIGQLIDTPPFESREFMVDAQGNLVIASSNRIRKISPAGVTTEFGLAGSPGAVDGPGDTARFSEIRGLAGDAAGNIYVADKDNHAIRKISPAGIVSTVVGKLGSSGIVLGDLPGSLYQPSGLAFDKEGMLYISSGDAILKVKLP